jgi:hypothetical protein
MLALLDKLDLYIALFLSLDQHMGLNSHPRMHTQVLMGHHVSNLNEPAGYSGS